ncbi:MAG: hypothetical protein M1812_005631 [Candelaria pacifica]|nr:MAG: hypothetical protein M1812_005631 [Candelaria pacifica]
MAEDPFDSLLGLEDKFYEEGYQLGVADGSQAGRIEGRVFGLERGFEKYAAMGKLHGRSAVWAGRLPRAAGQGSQTEQSRGMITNHHTQSLKQSESDLSEEHAERKEAEVSGTRLSSLPENIRLAKHIQTLYALVEPASLSTQNSEESVSDFDDRLKRAMAKIKVIEKLVGEAGLDNDESGSAGLEALDGHGKNEKLAGKSEEEGNIEDISALKARH